MINRIGTISMFVEDQDRAKDWYTNVLGFELLRDEPLYPGAPNRWVAVAPKGTNVEVVLYKIDENWQHYQGVIGKSQAITFEVTDMMSIVADLKSKGVRIVSEPDPQPWGTYATIEDSEGNKFLLVEQPKR
jgi:lactoylglutathione lyase